MEKGKVVFRHVRVINPDNTINNLGGATIAYQDYYNNKIKVSIAVCSAKDNFCKKTGRIIAGGRLNSDKQSSFVNMSWDEFHKVLPKTFNEMDNAWK